MKKRYRVKLRASSIYYVEVDAINEGDAMSEAELLSREEPLDVVGELSEIEPADAIEAELVPVEEG